MDPYDPRDDDTADIPRHTPRHGDFTVPGDGPLANTPWPMFRHGLQHNGSIQAAPGTSSSGLRPAHYSVPSTLDSDGNSTKNAIGADTQNAQSEISAEPAAPSHSQPSLNIARQLDGTMGIEVRGETGRHYVVETSTNLADWTAWADFVSDQPIIVFEESRVTNTSPRFYRIVVP